MSNKQFNNRYSIEYLHPGNLGSSKSKTKGLIIPLIILLALIALGAFFWEQGFFNQPLKQNSEVTAINSTVEAIEEQEPVETIEITENSLQDNLITTSVTQTNNYSRGKEIFLDKCSYCHGKNGQGNLKDTYPKLQGQNTAYILLQLQRMRDGRRLNVNPAMFKIIKKMDDNTFKQIAMYISQMPTPKNPLEKEKENILTKNNQVLANKLQELSNQLSTEQEKNLQLSEQLRKNLEVSKNISKLYDDAIKNPSGSDKDFMTIVESEKNRLANVVTKTKKKQESAEETVNQRIATTIVATDAAGISTSDQMNNIVSLIKNNSTSTHRPVSTKRVYVEIESDSAKKSVVIQDKINQLVSKKDIPTTKFTKALKKEAKVRKNALRTIVARKGDTLWSIAKKAYGSGFKYPKILKANPRLKKGKVVRIYIGQVIRVPR